MGIFVFSLFSCCTSLSHLVLRRFVHVVVSSRSWLAPSSHARLAKVSLHAALAKCQRCDAAEAWEEGLGASPRFGRKSVGQSRRQPRGLKRQRPKQGVGTGRGNWATTCAEEEGAGRRRGAGLQGAWS